MGLISRLFGAPQAVGALAEATRGVAEVFIPNATRSLELSAEAQSAALAQHAAEFRNAPRGWFDGLVNGLNRLPRPMLAFGSIGLFAYAMADPPGFGVRMEALGRVPEPLWWLMGAVVAFYFGARETHHFRARQIAARPETAPAAPEAAVPAPPEAAVPAPPARGNPALEDWRRSGRGA
jgi:hypothetical protein